MRRSAIGSSILLAIVMLMGTAGPALAQGVVVSGSGSGANEVPAGRGESGAKVNATFAIDTASGKITYTVRVQGVAEKLTAVHIHKAPAGTNGPVVVPLDTAAASAGTTATTTVEPSLAKEIAANPQDFYLNVHSASFAPPAGNARAQLGSARVVPAGGVGTGAGGAAPTPGRNMPWAPIGVAAAGAVLVATTITTRRLHRS